MALDLDAIEAEIDRLEAKETTFYVCSRLAALYDVRDHLRPQAKGESAIVPDMEGTEFLDLVSGKRTGDVMLVVDEHLSTIKALFPKSYDSIMQRIREL
jgi:hypothetical protein